MLISAIVTFGAFLFLWFKIAPSTRAAILRHPFATDVTLSLGVMIGLGAITATISGMIIAAYVGLFVSAALWIRPKLFEHERKIDGRWTKCPPQWFSPIDED